MTPERLRANVEAVRANLASAEAKWGRAVTLCAVTKTVDAETVNMARECGILDIGENRVQEAMQKLPALNPQFRLHMIGQLQTNKVKYIIDRAAMIQSLDRIELAREIDRRAQGLAFRMPVLVQVNIAQEPQKSGVLEDGLMRLVLECARMDGLRVSGLMAIMPLEHDPERVRPHFRRMREWFDRLRDLDITGVEMECLSMGMSGDYQVAADEGATMVRVGSSIFGSR